MTTQACHVCDDPHDTLCEHCGKCICYRCSYATEDGYLLCPYCHDALQLDMNHDAKKEAK